MNKKLKSELWEIQAILYFILGHMVKTHWLSIACYVWATVTLLGAKVVLDYQHMKERLK